MTGYIIWIIFLSIFAIWISYKPGRGSMDEHMSVLPGRLAYFVLSFIVFCCVIVLGDMFLLTLARTIGSGNRASMRYTPA